ncbi:MAG TPA: thioether cross-link-forming SCIFF peptide maturase [Epulopiscium sp.]|nr:thioether cross-link-forming SCIFF peptide maturase [Candidatus Epulonipiscium sp.]
MLHKFIFENSKIVMDIYSGAIHIVDEIVYEMVDDFKNMTKEKLIEKYKKAYDEEAVLGAISEIETLIEDEMLFTDDVYQNLIPEFKNRNPVVKALCLHVAHDCNLTCGYCFAEEGEYHGTRGLMSAEVGKASIDFLMKNSGNRRNIEVDFFGGEPLMNFEVVKEVVEYARSIEKSANKNFRFTITTNGVLLDDEKAAYINEHMSNVVLSLDGRPEVNDHMRQTHKGTGSYDLITPKFQKLVKERGQKDYYVRGTFTRHNLDFAKDVMHLADLGFEQVSVEPVVGPVEMDYTFKPEDVEVIYAEYESLARQMLQRKKEGKDFNFFHFNIDLSQGPCAHKRLAGCGTGTEYLAATPNGDLYPCHQFAGMEEFKMGDVFNGVTEPQLSDKFAKCHVYSKPKCTQCWAKFYCSGGCMANAYNLSGDIHDVYEIGCDLQKKRVECAIGIQAEMLKD